MPEILKLPRILSLPAPNDREAIEGRLRRLIIGLDINDPEMFDSALAKDARWELHIKSL